MNIVLLTSSLGAGGAERVATTLANAWTSNLNHKVTLISTFSGFGSSFYKVSEKVELIFLADSVGYGENKNGKRYIKRLLMLRELITSRKPDAVVSFLPNVNVAGILARLFTSIPIIVCERSDPTQESIGYAWQLACKLLYRLSNAVVVQTHSVARSIHHVYGGLSNVFVIPNPIPENVFNYKISEKQPDQRRVLLSMGRLSPEKRVDRIISAFSAVYLESPNWDLHIYGDGPLRDELRLLVANSGLSRRVFFMGRTTEPWAVMQSADAFIMTSAYEGFPNALLEAMAVGLPCLAVDCLSGPAEITRNGLDAILVDSSDESELVLSLRSLLCNDVLRLELSEKARSSVWGRYAISTVLDDWESVFASLGGAS